MSYMVLFHQNYQQFGYLMPLMMVASAYNDAYAPDGCNPLLAAGSGIPGCAQQAITDAPLTSAKIDFIAPLLSGQNPKY